jgi:TolA-binding protein
MKRAIAGILFASVFAVGVARAADAVTLAAQQEAEERYRRLAATVEEIQSAQMAQQKQISGLGSDLSKLRDEVSRNNNNAANQESIRRLNEQILKVDESRIADNKRIQEALAQLGKAIREMPSAPAPRPRDPTPIPSPGPSASGSTRNGSGSPTIPEEGFEYVIQAGDRLDVIVKKYRDEKIMVTSKSITDANPTVNWSKLRIGQKIFIPKPKS